MSNVVILSGGMDSTVALAKAITETSADETRAVSFHYGQRHRRELESARHVAEFYGIDHRIVDIQGLLGGSALLDMHTDVPDGHYAEETMKATVVLGRNLMFASAGVGQCDEGDELWFGVHAGDHPIYPDCRPEFWDLLTDAVSTAYGVFIRTPFLHLEKANIAGLGSSYLAPLHLSWSCYKGGVQHCGRCGTCVERAEAFALAGVDDPTSYADTEFWRSVTA